MSSASLDRTYQYHPPFGTQQERYERIRAGAKVFATLIAENSPPSREQSVAFTNVQQATMWTNAAIAINEQAPAEPVAASTESV